MIAGKIRVCCYLTARAMGTQMTELHASQPGWSAGQQPSRLFAWHIGYLLAAALLITACEGGSTPQDMAGQPAPGVSHAETGTQAPVDALEAGMVNPGYAEKPAWFANSFLDMREDVAEAAAAGKRVMLYFYQDGCPYCKKLLDTNFALSDTVRRTRENFEVIAINMWGDRPTC